jgi:hypothetical protein
MTIHSRHTEWCARGHRCGLGEHRAEPIAVHVPEVGIGVLTRVCDSDGQQYAEIRVRVALPTDEMKARLHLATILTRLPVLMNVRAER